MLLLVGGAPTEHQRTHERAFGGLDFSGRPEWKTRPSQGIVQQKQVMAAAVRVVMPDAAFPATSAYAGDLTPVAKSDAQTLIGAVRAKP